MNKIPLPEGYKDLHEYLTHAPTIVKLMIIENELALDSKAYTYGQINKLLSANYVPGDFNYVPFIQSDEDLAKAFANAHRALSSSKAPWYSYPCAECHDPIVLTRIQSKLYRPTYCPKCLAKLLHGKDDAIVHGKAS